MHADQCSFVSKPSQAVRAHLQENLKGQERAVEAVVGAIEAWEFSCVVNLWTFLWMKKHLGDNEENIWCF